MAKSISNWKKFIKLTTLTLLLEREIRTAFHKIKADTSKCRTN